MHANDEGATSNPQDGSHCFYVNFWYLDTLPNTTETIDDMIQAYRLKLEKLERMRTAGVGLAKIVRPVGGDDIGDYALLFTTEPGVAKLFDFYAKPMGQAEWEYYLDWL